MKRKQKVLDVLEMEIEGGNKPSAKAVAKNLGWALQDVHRCLNILEKENEVFSYRKEFLGNQRRMIGIKRN